MKFEFDFFISRSHSFKGLNSHVVYSIVRVHVLHYAFFLNIEYGLRGLFNF